MTTNKSWISGIALGVLVPLGVLGANLTTPHLFTPGTTIRSSEVNANFAAVQTAVNSKLDASAAIASGTRLQLIGLGSADGLKIPQLVIDHDNHPQVQLYDRTLGTYCMASVASDHKTRCLPNYFPSKLYFSDPTCMYGIGTMLAAGEAAAPGLPPITNRYLPNVTYFPDQTSYREIYTAVPYMGPVYELAGNAFCQSIAVAAGTSLYRFGTVVAPSTFAELSPTAF